MILFYFNKSLFGSDFSRRLRGGEGCDDENAVQGPINEEPEEKLFPEKFQKPTVIQKL